jgi:GR25 family glycosyltransferase involved in LPS biosynthesis
MDSIDVIFYINLEKRLDRKEHFLNEIIHLCKDPSKIIRIDAVYDKVGAIGATKSHIKTLETFMDNPLWKTCIIFEDDFTFYDSSIENNNNKLSTIFTEFPDWGIIYLSTNQLRQPPTETSNKEILKVNYTQTASGYIIKKEYANDLCNNFKESKELLTNCWDPENYALDTYWNKLSMNRYCFRDNIGYQYSSFSDIEKRVVDYKC